jgi:hypothetical protein
MNLLGLGLSQSRFSPRKLRPSLYLSADRGVYQDAAVQFVAADASWLQIADADQTGLDLGTDDALMCGWVWLDSLTTTHALFGQTYSMRLFTDSTGFVKCDFGPSGKTVSTQTAKGALTTGKWTHVAAHADRSGLLTIYIDGESAATGDISSLVSTDIDVSYAFAVGASSAGGLPLDGRVDSLMFFKAADLSAVAADIIAWAYNGGSGRLCAEITDEQKAAWGAVSGWEFAEASGQRKDSWGTNHLSEQLGEGITEIARAPGIVRAIATNGDGVSYWQDQSTGGKHAAQITLAKRPTLVTSGINSRPVIRGDGVDDYLEGYDVQCTGAFAVSTVFACDASPLNVALLAYSFGGSVYLTDNTTVTVRTISLTPAEFTVGEIGTDPHILTITRDVDNAVRVYLDGVESSSGAKTLMGALGVDLMLGEGDQGYFAGDVAEVLVYDGEKTAAELARLHTYLARRYGITI